MPIVGDSVWEARVLDRDQLAVKKVLFSHLNYFADGFGACSAAARSPSQVQHYRYWRFRTQGSWRRSAKPARVRLPSAAAARHESTKVDRSAATVVVGCQRPARCRATSVAMSCDDTATRPSLWLVTYKHAARHSATAGSGPAQPGRRPRPSRARSAAGRPRRSRSAWCRPRDRRTANPRHRAGQSRVNRNAISGWRCRRVSFMLHLPGWRAASGQ